MYIKSYLLIYMVNNEIPLPLSLIYNIILDYSDLHIHIYI